MMSASWVTVAEMQTRDLVRRHAALILLLALPLTWYVAEVASGVDYAVGTGVLGIAWSGAVVPLFAVLGARQIDQRLVQAGYRPRDIVAGRLIALLGITTLMALCFGVVMTVGSRPERVGDVILALVLTVAVSAPIGWLTAAMVPRELEGTLLLIGLVGLQISIPVGGPEWILFYWAPLRLTDYERAPIGPLWPILQALAWSIVIAIVAITVWRRRVLVRGDAAAR
jgi:hypothetical protein